MTTQDEMKRLVAEAAVQEVIPHTIIGVGTGSTVNYFIDALARAKIPIIGAVASSQETARRLRAHNIRVVDLNEGPVSVYLDGADECNDYGQLIKGGGGALTREKIVAHVAETFVCFIDSSKRVSRLGKFPLAVEVLELARSSVARALVKLGGDPEYRQGFITDNGHQILDVHNLIIDTPIALEEAINHIPGVVCNGLFAKRGADKVLIATPQGIELLIPN